MKWGFLFLLGLLVSSPVFAEEVVHIGNYQTAQIIWDWDRGPHPQDGIPTHYTLSCGKRNGPYVTQPPMLATDPFPYVRNLVPGPGIWECLIVPSNSTGEGPAYRFPFDVRAGVPAAVSNVRLK
jgi:hypothetical protein